MFTRANKHPPQKVGLSLKANQRQLHRKCFEQKFPGAKSRQRETTHHEMKHEVLLCCSVLVQQFLFKINHGRNKQLALVITESQSPGLTDSTRLFAHDVSTDPLKFLDSQSRPSLSSAKI